MWCWLFLLRFHSVFLGALLLRLWYRQWMSRLYWMHNCWHRNETLCLLNRQELHTHTNDVTTTCDCFSNCVSYLRQIPWLIKFHSLYGTESFKTKVSLIFDGNTFQRELIRISWFRSPFNLDKQFLFDEWKLHDQYYSSFLALCMAIGGAEAKDSSSCIQLAKNFCA